VVFDYTGYGQSRMPNVGEDVICKDLELVLAWLRRPLSEIILWGFSLGTFPVVMNAARFSVKAAILQCPIGSLACMFAEDFRREVKFREDHFANIDHIGNVRGRVLLMHSLADEVIPVEQAHLLFQKYTGQNGERHITFIELEKIAHNDLHRYIVSPHRNDLQQELLHFLTTNANEIHPARTHTRTHPTSLALDLLYDSILLAGLREEEEVEVEVEISSSRAYFNNEQWPCCRK
jgi:fermentation-respiration switch protein FrsA (DUF1100 family)